MQIVVLKYICSRCGNEFDVHSKIPPDQISDLVESHIHGTQPPISSLSYGFWEYEIHECPDVDIVVKGIGAFVGYSLKETNNSDQKGKSDGHLTVVKG